MEIAASCLGAILVVAASFAISTSIVFLTANYLLCPAFGWHSISWLQSLAICIALGVVGSYFKTTAGK